MVMKSIRNVVFVHLPVTVGGCSSCRRRLSHSISCGVPPLDKKNQIKEAQCEVSKCVCVCGGDLKQILHRLLLHTGRPDTPHWERKWHKNAVEGLSSAGRETAGH